LLKKLPQRLRQILQRRAGCLVLLAAIANGMSDAGCRRITTALSGRCKSPAMATTTHGGQWSHIPAFGLFDIGERPLLRKMIRIVSE